MMHVRFWFPSRDRHGADLTPAALAPAYADARATLIALGGGVTATDARGAWVNAAGQVVSEPVVVLETFAPATADVAVVTALAGRVAAALDQESVMVVVNGQPTFVAAAARAG